MNRGYQYTTAIYYHTMEQATLAEISFDQQDNAGIYELPIVTEILPYTHFSISDDEEFFS